MDAGKFANTTSHMVQEVKNIIDGYKMGPLRALAQEPVQNALDAKRNGISTVSVEYRLLRRKTSASDSCFVLTVTDSGTTGLRGPLVDADELQARNFKLQPEENWAAFEARGYTKENEDALGSRGQGKAAFLYHSQVPGETRRMAMLYDTLLENGEYRLGMRFARPVDQILTPPLYNDEAKDAIQSDTYALEDRLEIPLGLEPLREIGTRVIVPYLSDDDANSVRPSGELCAWLQRCWWRAIQLGKLQIRVVVDETGAEEMIKPPTWWQDLPREKGKPKQSGFWIDLPDGGRACTWGELPLDDGHQIRRLVILNSNVLEEDEITKDNPEFCGIQILRGSQWIETRGARQEFGDKIPPDRRPGFRGYVEFDRQTDSLMRVAENSQHDGFDARRKDGKIIRDIRNELEKRVGEFSEQMGWETPQAMSKQRVSQREQQTHTRFLETFLNPNGRKTKSSKLGDQPEDNELLWECHLDLDYPDPKSAQVNWGQSICRVYVEVEAEPVDETFDYADVVLEWVDATGNSREIKRLENFISGPWDNRRVQKSEELGDWMIVRGKASHEKQIECPLPGECKLRAVVIYLGERVKSAARTIYVQTEPPPPPGQNPVTLSISAVNDNDGEKKRIDHGDVLLAQFNARNRMLKKGQFTLTASLRLGEDAEILALNLPVELDGTPAGDTAVRKDIVTVKRQLLDPQQARPLMMDSIQQLKMPDSSGRYTINADLYDENGEVAAHASKPIYFQRDPGKAQSRLPFEIRQEQQRPMWLMNDDLSILTYPSGYPLYKEMKDVHRQNRALQGRQAFIAEISANGLLEWAMRPKKDGDDSNYDQMYDEDRGSSDDLWDAFNRGLENMSQEVDTPTKFAKIWRETVAIMLDIFAREND